MNLPLSPKKVQLVQMATFVLFIAFLVMNRFGSSVPDFVQGFVLGMCIVGFVFVLFNYKLLKKSSRK